MAAADLELIGGPKKADVVIADYDPQWPRRYQDHARRIGAALGARALQIEHIGSTSVPGLPAKPIIDMLLVVAHPEQEGTYLPDLEPLGYVLRVREPSLDEHRMLRTRQRDVHLHVHPPTSAAIERYLLLRDLLRHDGAARTLYTDTKRSLAQRDWPTMNHYAEAKTDVIEALIRRGRT